jgi:hypothetical protein
LPLDVGEHTLIILPLAWYIGLASSAPADRDAYQIFERARRVLQAQLYPSPLFYRITIYVSEGERDESEHFQGVAFSGTDVRVEGVSDEEQAAPHESSGVNFKFAFSLGWNTGAGGQNETVSQDAHRRGASPDYLGVPFITPFYSFGLTSARAEDPTPAAVSSLPTIATVTSTGRVYNISLLGTEPIGGLYAYHLRLEPTSHPERYRIRELWVDAYTYQILQFQTQGNFTSRPMAEVPWLVTLQDVDGSLYIQSEKALEPLTFQHDRTFSTASITFDEIRATADSPPILPALDGHADIDLREPGQN